MTLVLNLVLVAALVYVAIDFVRSFRAASGTVWQRLLATGRQSATILWQRFTIALAAPFAVAFLILPDLIMAALFRRGAFDAAAAARAGAVLAAYAVGLPAVVLIRSAVASF